MKFRPLNFKDHSELIRVVTIHEEMPALWTPNYKVNPKEVQNEVKTRSDHQNDPNYFYMLALEQNSIIGMVWAVKKDYPRQSFAYITSMWVDPDFRKQGIAKELFQHAKDWAKSHGLQSLEVDVHSNNVQTMALAKATGFKENYVQMSISF